MRVDMRVETTSRYLNSLKKFKRNTDLLNKIDDALKLFCEDPHNATLHFKKITCKRDKFRHSIRVPSTQYRILMSVFDDYATLFCICNHTKYDHYNKNC